MMLSQQVKLPLQPFLALAQEKEVPKSNSPQTQVRTKQKGHHNLR
jgi:hypothetical protein